MLSELHAQLDTQQTADQTADDADGHAQIQADAALNARQHGQNQHAVHAQTHQRIAKLAGQGQIQNQRQQAQQHEEGAYDQARHAHLLDQRAIEEHHQRQQHKAHSAQRERAALTQDHAERARIDAAGRLRAVILAFKGVIGGSHHGGDGRLQGGKDVVGQRREDHLDLLVHVQIRLVHLRHEVVHFLGRHEAGQVDGLFHRHLAAGVVGHLGRIFLHGDGVLVQFDVFSLRTRLLGVIRLLRVNHDIQRSAQRGRIDGRQIHSADAEFKAPFTLAISYTTSLSILLVRNQLLDYCCICL